MKIKFVANVTRWFDKLNGNTYTSVRVTRCKDGKVGVVPMTYGYGDYYKQATLEVLDKKGWLPKTYRNVNTWRYERENDYPIQWIVSDGLKRVCEQNGIL